MIPSAVIEAFQALLKSGVAAVSSELEPSAVTGGMRFTCTLPVPQPNPEKLPPAARFEVTIPAVWPHGKLEIVSKDPEVQGFAHQAYDGTVCLEPEAILPSAAGERIVASINGAIEWLTDAANRRLVVDGQPWELPDFRPYSEAPTIFFLEADDAYPAWSARVGESGCVDLADHRSVPGFVGVRFYREGGLVMAPRVSGDFCTATRSTPAEWILLSSLVFERNRPPRTFAELDALAKRAGIDIWQPIHRALKHRPAAGHRYVLVGAPIPTQVGGAAVEIHWQPIAVPEVLARSLLAGSTTRTGEIRRDRLKVALADRKIPWARSSNVAGERLLIRGALADAARKRRLCVLGNGAIGGPLTEHLVRGGVHDLSCFDGQTLEFPNLGRHNLAPADVGVNKAVALVRRLSGIHPDSAIAGYPWPLPLSRIPSTAPAWHALEVADVILECTASDSVLRWASDLGKKHGATVISIYVNAGATMMTLIASGRHASCRKVDSLFRADIARGATPFTAEEHSPTMKEIEPGAGCWSPTFPARGCDITLLVAAAVPLIEKLIERERRSHGAVLVLRRHEVDDPLEQGPVVERVFAREYR